MYQMTDEEFEAAMEEALDAIPEQFLDALHNIAIVWMEEPSDYHLGLGADAYEDGEWEDGEWDEEDAGAGDSEWDEEDAGAWNGEEDGGSVGAWDAEDAGAWEDGEDYYEPLPRDLLGLFDGLSIQERLNGVDDEAPDVITVFKGPHERCFGSREQIVKEIGKTIVHELGHYFGLDEERLAAMGYE